MKNKLAFGSWENLLGKDLPTIKMQVFKNMSWVFEMLGWSKKEDARAN